MVNDWVLGTMYYPGGGFGLPGIGRGFTQPGGVNTPVLPMMITDPSSTISPFSSAPVSEFSGVFFWGCGHSTDNCACIPEFDATIPGQVMLIVCPRCSFIQNSMPLAQFYNTTTNPVTFP
jgi:hypothetical protein